jgi:hypothetical protein
MGKLSHGGVGELLINNIRNDSLFILNALTAYPLPATLSLFPFEFYTAVTLHNYLSFTRYILCFISIESSSSNLENCSSLEHDDVMNS